MAQHHTEQIDIRCVCESIVGEFKEIEQTNLGYRVYVDDVKDGVLEEMEECLPAERVACIDCGDYCIVSITLDWRVRERAGGRA